MRGRSLPVLLMTLAAAGTAGAHPIPADTHDRTLALHLTPEAVLIEYHLEVDEVVAAADLRRTGEAAVTAGPDRHRDYLRHYTSEVQSGLRVALDGRERDLECIDQRSRLGEHVYCTWRFRARWRLAGAGRHRLDFFEGNFPRESAGGLRMTLSSSPDLTLTDPVVPGDGKAAGDRARRTVRADVRAIPSRAAGVVRPGLPPPAEPARPGARGRARRRAASAKPVPPGSFGVARTLTTGGGPAEAGGDRLVDLLFDTRRGFLALLALAAAFGAAHALLPGHGKTVVAAYLIGQRGSPWHALFLGLVTAATHSAVVLAVAALLPALFASSPTARVRAALELTGGLLLTGLGLYLLVRRLAGPHDPAHPGGCCRPRQAPAAPTAWGLAVLGVGGGLVPCWDAVALLLVAISTQHLRLALPLLLAFSAGLAAALVGFGLVVIRSASFLRARLPTGSRHEDRLGRLLPAFTAGVILAAGLWLCYRGLPGG